ncbi:hypothetical protein ACTXT7_013084 [Hymenolepis weldensis]
MEMDEDAIEKIRNRARQATSDFLDSCDAIRQKAKAKDEDALRKFDAAIKLPMSTPQKDSNNSVRRGSLGLPPIMPRANHEGSFVSDTIITVSSPLSMLMLLFLHVAYRPGLNLPLEALFYCAVLKEA